MAIDPKSAAAVLAVIDEQELVDLVLTLANIESPPGGEGPVGDAIHGWLHQQGFSPMRVGMFDDRFNVFAELPGRGSGPALAFNAHMDTSGGSLEMDLNHLENPDLTVTLDYATAKAILVEGNPQAGMQAFMAGKIKVQGDITKLMAMQQGAPDESAAAVAERIKDITE